MDKKDEKGDLDEQSKIKRKYLFVELQKINLRQEAILKQKSRYNWLGSGNMKIFHTITRWRSMQNMIKGLKVHNEWCEDPEIVKKGVKECFQKRLSENVSKILSLGNVAFPTITEHDNMVLTRNFSEEEL